MLYENRDYSELDDSSEDCRRRRRRHCIAFFCLCGIISTTLAITLALILKFLVFVSNETKGTPNTTTPSISSPMTTLISPLTILTTRIISTSFTATSLIISTESSSLTATTITETASASTTTTTPTAVKPVTETTTTITFSTSTSSPTTSITKTMSSTTTTVEQVSATVFTEIASSTATPSITAAIEETFVNTFATATSTVLPLPSSASVTDVIQLSSVVDETSEMPITMDMSPSIWMEDETFSSIQGDASSFEITMTTFTWTTETESITTTSTTTTIVPTTRACIPACFAAQTCVNGFCVGSGRFAISVTWSIAGDGDIVITTPNNKSIYYSKKGPDVDTDWGSLDRDDTSGTGPENVFWNGTYTPPTGNYHICFQQYGLNATVSRPVTATIEVRKPFVANQVFSKTFTSKTFPHPNQCFPNLDTYVVTTTYP